ncbi:hypothetical protein GN156_07790 [bacterium LRH843]|nr:hypothetical protein [bacterium LRH843]
MKRLLPLSMTMLFIIFLAACGNQGTPIEPNENTMIINIKNNSTFDFYGLEVNILEHSPSIVNADGSKIEKGEELRFEFLQEDFELDGEADMDVFILTEGNIEGDEDRIPINNKILLELVSNKEIFFELVGESINEADLKRLNL